MNEKKFMVAWYYHLPSVSTDEEINDIVKTSLGPLLSLHKRYRRPFTLSITGSLLKRIDNTNKSILGLMKELMDIKILEISATFYYEIYPPVVPYEYIKLHIKKDIETKEELLGVAPSTFYPPNFTWVSILSQLLPDFGIRHVILDEDHYKLCFKVQTWKWDLFKTNEMETLLVDTFLDRTELHRIYRHKVKNSDKENTLILFFRNFDIVKKLSFGISGLFHKPLDWGNLEKYLQETISQLDHRDYITLADDGDRINPVSLYNYGKFLKNFNDINFVTPSSINYTNIDLSYVPYLPSYSLGDMRSFWLRDLDSIHYSNLLNDIYALNYCLKGVEEDIMELQDVYFIFWKTISRKKYYMEKLYNILKTLEKREKCISR